MRKVLQILLNSIITMKKKILGLSAAILMICSIGVNSISAQNMQCILDPDSMTEPTAWLVCWTFNCPDGTEAYQCNMREIIIH
jgi:hypothetical protein